MKNNEWKLAEIEFHVDGIKHSFKCINNMPETFGLSLQNAVENWSIRTDDPSFDSLRKYVYDKTPEFRLYTEKEWEELS